MLTKHLQIEASPSSQGAFGLKYPPEVSTLAALVEISDEILHATTRPTAIRSLAAGIRGLLECRYVGVAIKSGDRFEVELFTHLDDFDRNSAEIRQLEDLCDFQSKDAGGIPRDVSVKTGERVCMVPFRSLNAGVFAYALIPNIEFSRPMNDATTLTVLGEQLGPVLELKLMTLRQSRWLQAVTKVRDAARRNKWQARAILALVAAIALIPLPYRIRCDAELQPVVRRHVAAPFEGILRQCLVKPGDVVSAGQVLGRMDAKELNWELAAATADRDRAAKSGDVNLAAGKAAAAQIDRFESRRLAERVKLLESRLAQLDISTPQVGVVVSGNLERAEGAPVKVGQTLFEVAPLERMIVEVLIPEYEIDRASIGQTVDVYLDSVPGEALTGAVLRIHPRAELRNGANVFVAELELDNHDDRLRPGMKGIARLATQRRPLAWIAAQRLGELFWRVVR